MAEQTENSMLIGDIVFGPKDSSPAKDEGTFRIRNPRTDAAQAGHGQTAHERAVAGPSIDAQPLRIEYATANIPKGTRDDDFPIEPFEDCVYIEPFEEQVSKGGILIAHTKESKMPQGRVVAVGPGRFYFAAMNASQTMQAAIFVPTRIKVGDVVVWGRYATGGEPLEYNGKRYVAAREGDLGGIIVGGKMIDLRVVRQSGD